ncbi:MAG: HAMP domain-containing histidine kinase [Deltaproteobacteria bacterium]|nr:HAMP domain-containing histidine kinase [Deltaproteobacteria bacterium]
MDLRIRFTIFFSLLLLVLLSFFSFFIYDQAKKKSFSFAEESLEAFLNHERSHSFTSHHDKPGGDDSPHFKNIYFRIWNQETIVYDSFPAGYGQEFPFAGEKARNKLFRQLSHSRDGQTYNLQAYYDLASVLEYLSLLKTSLLVACGIAALIIFPLGLLSTKFLLMPFHKLAVKTEELSAEKLSFRFPQPRQKDEFGRLVESFNQLLNRLEQSFEQVQRFAANASHELRTPLAVIISQGEMALRREREISEYQNSLSKILFSAKTLRNIVNRLLFLAELEHTEHGKYAVDIPVEKTIQDIFFSLGEIHSEKIFNLEITPSSLCFRGSLDIFHSIVTNLLENALKHSRSTVLIRGKKEVASLVLSFEDDGSGISNEERELVFEPFYKVSTGKASHSGYGLGLSIVKACTDVVDGKITLGSSNLGGLMVDVQLPEISS